jgi:hypothetical protein
VSLAGIENDRLRPEDWRDKYRWPDPDRGWEGGLAGYPPDHPARGSRPRSVTSEVVTRNHCEPEVVTPLVTPKRDRAAYMRERRAARKA